MKIIGRDSEIAKLENAYSSNQSEFVAIYGRFRIGKTFLISNLFEYRLLLSFTSVPKSNPKDTLLLLSKTLHLNRLIENWFDAFDLIKDLIEKSPLRRKVIFLDELSWLDTPNSKFLQALSFFWNNFCSHRDDVMLIVSGSATSWIKNKIINDIGGLYNRLTLQIHLLPFSLKECEEYLLEHNIHLSKYDIIRLYMVFGGIPHYLSLLDRTFSVADNIDNLLFKENGTLKNEHENLFRSLFKNSNNYISTINSISSSIHGLTRQQIINETKQADNGHLTTILNDLENNGFIKKYLAFPEKNKEATYQIYDNFILFYHTFILQKTHNNEHFYHDNQQSPTLNSWRGLAFEVICQQHINQIKNALGIIGISATTSAFQNSDCQIDLIITRNDLTINLCEIKFYKDEFEIDKEYHQKLLRKVSTLEKVSKNKYSINLTFITIYGIKKNIYSSSVVSVVTADDFFVKK
jgi:AAA+ ATPase superfamily predicted ATPase